MHNYDRTTLFIDGQWVTPDGDDAIEVVDPATEQVIGTVPSGTAADVDAAVAAARRTGVPSGATVEDMVAVAGVLDAMVASHQGRRWVTL